MGRIKPTHVVDWEKFWNRPKMTLEEALAFEAEREAMPKPVWSRSWPPEVDAILAKIEDPEGLTRAGKELTAFGVSRPEALEMLNDVIKEKGLGNLYQWGEVMDALRAGLPRPTEDILGRRR
jgi:hypothetical protein